MVLKYYNWYGSFPYINPPPLHSKESHLPIDQSHLGKQGTQNSRCDGNIFNGSTSHVALFSQYSNSTSPQNFASYDDLVDSSTPIILTAFEKRPTLQTTRWADTRLVCLEASNIGRGSRIPNSGNTVAPLLSLRVYPSVAIVWALLHVREHL
jgi:hypothetical protein